MKIPHVILSERSESKNLFGSDIWYCVDPSTPSTSFQSLKMTWGWSNVGRELAPGLQ